MGDLVGRGVFCRNLLGGGVGVCGLGINGVCGGVHFVNWRIGVNEARNA